MIRCIESHRVEENVWYYEFAGTSNDTKPVIGGTVIKVVDGERENEAVSISTGSVFLEVDTGNVYLFDEDDLYWYKVGEEDSSELPDGFPNNGGVIDFQEGGKT